MESKRVFFVAHLFFRKLGSLTFIRSGQIVAASHDLTPILLAFWKGNPLISGKSRLVKYYSIWPDPFIKTWTKNICGGGGGCLPP